MATTVLGGWKLEVYLTKKIILTLISLFLLLTTRTLAQLQSEQPLAVLKASGDDLKTPLIVLLNPIAKPKRGESIESEKEKEATLIQDSATIPLVTDTTASTEKPTKKTEPLQKQKPARSHGQKKKHPMQDLLLMPGMWESSPIARGPINTVATQPVFYPLPVYIPYPIPFMLNQQMHLMSKPSRDNVEDQIALDFNELMSVNLLRSSLEQYNGAEWQKIMKSQMKPPNQDGPKKWRGKWRKTTTSTTTSATKAPVTSKTEPTRLLLNSSPPSGNEEVTIETTADNEAIEAAS
ncbi:uncharacterized protein LOC108027140 [Drosophila biarmipes]|uniref:uncharacterized protein LOC108027140 n=1 Tax=Drosophila biarmipes TaxID=125945 RepID=UPI001CDA5D9D|nr:uncharacterized protein LOC108027140 [Drosophila biarmipes]